MTKNKKVTIKFSEKEYKQIQKKSEENCLPISSYIRERIFFDAPIIERYSFEFKVLKALSFCAAALAELCAKFLTTKAENEAFIKRFRKIAIENGIDPDKVKKEM